MNRSTTSLRDLCASYPIIDPIFKELSASSAASFLAVIQLVMPDFPAEYFRKRYVLLMRDIPEYGSWIEDMMSKGHRAFLVGSDLGAWFCRLLHPISYWRKYPGGFAQEKPLRLWLAVRASRCFDGRPRHDSRASANCWITMDGDAVKGPEKYAELRGGRISTKSKLIPLPGDARSRHKSRTGWGEWLPSPKRNENNLALVWADVESTNQTPVVRMCPLQVSDRGSTDIMGGNHGYVCAYHSPGSIVQPSPHCEDQVIPELPYLDMATFEYSFADIIDDGDDVQEYAIRIRLDCNSARSQPGKALGPDIRAADKGIRWRAVPSSRETEGRREDLERLSKTLCNC